MAAERALFDQIDRWIVDKKIGLNAAYDFRCRLVIVSTWSQLVVLHKVRVVALAALPRGHPFENGGI
jgi:hypothetical protein